MTGCLAGVPVLCSIYASELRASSIESLHLKAVPAGCTGGSSTHLLGVHRRQATAHVLRRRGCGARHEHLRLLLRRLLRGHRRLLRGSCLRLPRRLRLPRGLLRWRLLLLLLRWRLKRQWYSWSSA